MKRILIVEDDMAIRHSLQSILEEEGAYLVTTAANGRTALLQGMDQRPDLILCDLHMPVMGGKEFAEHVRSHPDYGSIPIVMMTAYELERREAGLYTAVVQKPYALDQLLETIGMCLMKSASSRM